MSHEGSKVYYTGPYMPPSGGYDWQYKSAPSESWASNHSNGYQLSWDVVPEPIDKSGRLGFRIYHEGHEGGSLGRPGRPKLRVAIDRWPDAPLLYQLTGHNLVRSLSAALLFVAKAHIEILREQEKMRQIEEYRRKTQEQYKYSGWEKFQQLPQIDVGSSGGWYSVADSMTNVLIEPWTKKMVPHG